MSNSCAAKAECGPPPPAGFRSTAEGGGEGPECVRHAGQPCHLSGTQTHGGEGDHVDVVAIDPAVAVEVPLAGSRAAGLDVPGEPEGIEDVHAAVAVDIRPPLRRGGLMIDDG